ncbi:MFS transporter [Carboxydochorda subterranea]|uniref:MFS transporter n=1 Tax=Carboxydichorda subterranea TaxID=3109565 RepID=A0ABZ1BW95_9FIRM|nr:MFS transporter [Limnochorda sp. L945t]WRP16949.1 MFS transporter [Limnochorda sp. L945t]
MGRSEAASRPAAAGSGSYKWVALSCTSLGALLSVLNSTTLIIALPEVMKGLQASFEEVVWVLMGYMLAITVLVPSIGRVADMAGRKKLYVAGFAVFTAGSLVSGLAQSGAQLIVFRLVQAVGGSLMLANSTAIVTDAFPRGELGKALGVNAMVISVASLLGPILGGYLTELGWRWVFWFNVPLGVVGTWWAAAQLREVVRLPGGQRFDWPGAMTFVLGLLGILVVLSFGPLVGWLQPAMLGLDAVSIAALAAFVWWERRFDQPMLDLSLFRNRLLAAAYVSNLLNGVARGAVTLLLVFYFQGIRGYDPVKAGVMLSPMAAAMMAVAPVSGALSDRYGSRELSSIGLLASAVGLWGLTRIQPGTGLWTLGLWMAVVGAGSGFFNSPNTNAIMSAVAPGRRGIAGATRTMMMNAGSVISMALGLSAIISTMTPEALAGLFAGTQVGSQGIAIGQFIEALHFTFWVSVAISVLAAVLSLMRGKHSPATATGQQEAAATPGPAQRVVESSGGK